MFRQVNRDRKTCATTAAALLVTLTFITLDSLSLQLDREVLAVEQSESELLGSTSGNDAPVTYIFNLTSGYTIEPVVWNLTAPDTLTFDSNGTMFIGEAGYPFTDIPKVPRILKVTPSGNISIFVDRNLNSPIVDIVQHNGLLYVSHTHKISTVNLTNGAVKDIIVGLPSNINHPNNQIAFSPDGKRLYVGVGSATNSGVVGEDDYMLGRLANDPKGHDIPGMNITLTGQNFVTTNPLTAEKNDTTTTGAFVPFGSPTNPGQVIPGNTNCNACIISANLDGTDLKVVGWGLRNPTGLAFDEAGKLFAVNHGADQRGSRPIANDSDKFYEIKLNETAFYGWPDFIGNAEPVTDSKFQSPRGEGKPLEFLMQNHPPVEKPLALFEPVHVSGIQIDFANESFGLPGDAFVAQIGTDAPIARPILPTGTIIGQNVVRINVDNKTISEFLSLNNATTGFRPTDAVFSQNGTALYVVDWGNVSFTINGPVTTPNTGVVWKITPTAARNQ
jgi:glucose/arabinose dehydrogenase